MRCTEVEKGRSDYTCVCGRVKEIVESYPINLILNELGGNNIWYFDLFNDTPIQKGDDLISVSELREGMEVKIVYFSQNPNKVLRMIVK